LAGSSTVAALCVISKEAGLVVIPEDNGSGSHGRFFSYELNEKSGKGHDSALCHAPGGLNDHKVGIREVG